MTAVESDTIAANPSTYLEKIIGEGETVLVTVKGRPVAELRPPAAAMAAIHYETKYMPDEQDFDQCRDLLGRIELVRTEIGHKYGVELDGTAMVREDRDFLHG